MELDLAAAVAALGSAYFNVIRTGEEGLVLSLDHWRVGAVADGRVAFVGREPEAPPLSLAIQDIERITWERLPRQKQRSQIRFYLGNGARWTFSGLVDESALPAVE